MEEFLDENVYFIDLGSINTIPEIIFELSSYLDRQDAKNRRICLKLGDVNLNQAQLLSIKSLINGIGSSLSSIDTKSVETEKTALSLGIIVSNVLPENLAGSAPAEPYKTVDEFIASERQNIEQTDLFPSNDSDNFSEIRYEQQISSNESDVINEKEIENNELFNDENCNCPGNQASEQLSSSVDEAENCETRLDSKQVTEEIEEHKNDTVNNNEAANDDVKSVNLQENTDSNVVDTSTSDVSDNNENKQDELDVIFGKNPLDKSIFNTSLQKEKYLEREALTDIVVPEQEYTKEDIEIETFPTKYIKQTIRSGQVINYDGNIVIIGDCHPGSEISAFGDITVWGVLSGIAHAGTAGNQKARVRALKMNAIQLRIANCYSRRPDSLNTIFVEKTSSFTPEEARIINGEIVVFKIND